MRRNEYCSSTSIMQDSPLGYYGSHALRFGALACLFVAAVAPLLLSSTILDAVGFHYDTEGGSALEKVHPATIIITLSLALRVVSASDAVGVVRRVFLDDGHLLVVLASFAVLEAYVIGFLRVPMTGAIDTDLLPVLFCFALRGLDTRYLRRLAIVLLIIFAANAVFALYERATGTRLFFVIPDDITGHPEDPTTAFDWKGHLAWDWRSTALFGHPLENAILTGCIMLVMQARASAWLPALTRCGFLALQAAAMLTFGGRVALVLTILISAVWQFMRGVRALGSGARIDLRQQAALLCSVPIILIGAFVLLGDGALDKLFERFTDDEGSAQTRVTMWRLFTPISWGDLFTGPDPDVVATHQRIEGLELGIESFWAGLPLTYGIVMSAIVICGWIALALYLVKKAGREAAIVVAFYYLVGSASAGLASKTTSTGILVVMILAFMGGGQGGRAHGDNRPLTATA